MFPEREFPSLPTSIASSQIASQDEPRRRRLRRLEELSAPMGLFVELQPAGSRTLRSVFCANPRLGVAIFSSRAHAVLFTTGELASIFFHEAAVVSH